MITDIPMWFSISMACCSVPMLLVVLFSVWIALSLRARHLRTRDIPPEAGQVWLQHGFSGGQIYITTVGDDGTVHLIGPGPCPGTVGWSATAAEWENYVRWYRLILIEDKDGDVCIDNYGVRRSKESS